MEYFDELESLGVNVKEALGRVMDDADLYKMMLGMFLSSVQSDPVRPEDFDGGDLDGLIRRVHTLKGTAGNLSIMPVFDGYTEMLGLLRGGKPQEAKAIFVKLAPALEKILDCIQRNQ